MHLAGLHGTIRSNVPLHWYDILNKSVVSRAEESLLRVSQQDGARRKQRKRNNLSQGNIGSATRHAKGNVVHDGLRKQHRLLTHYGHLQKHRIYK